MIWRTIVLTVAAIGMSGHAALAQEARPNFVFIFTDDQRYDAMSVVQREQGDEARFPWFKTPNMDRLAAEGVRFRNAFVVNSLCSPSRACYLTGKYSHENGVANNHTPFPVDSVTHASLLRAAGYDTGYVGKWHMGPQSGQRPGFAWSASFVGQGKYFDCPVEINGKRTETKGWVDDVSTDFAIEFLRRPRSSPFLLVLGYKASHGPWDSPDRLQSELTEVEAKPAVSKDARPPYNKEPPAGGSVSPRTPMHRKYFRSLLGIDENLGRVLDAIDDLKLADDTMVVYASDNGYFLEEHGIGDKRAAYDESLRIPLLVRYPKLGLKGKTIDELALNIDLAPTLLSYAGLPVPKDMHGRSWKPLLEGNAKDWRQAFFYEYFYERNYRIPTILAVRTTTHKLIKYPGHDEWTEVFDLAADPHEMKNLAADSTSADLRKRLEAEFERQAQAVKFHVPAFADMPE